MLCFRFLLCFLLVGSVVTAWNEQISAIGDPGMRRDGLRVAIEAWNQCNEVHKELPQMGSPRQADCFDIYNSSSHLKLVHKVNEKYNKLGIANAKRQGLKNINVNQYAAWKERFLGYKCQVQDKPNPWQFWMIMLKSGNMDTQAAICPENGKKSKPFPPESRFPCFGKGCMNMPRMYHDYTQVHHNRGVRSLRGRFYGTWDLDADISTASSTNNTSYYSVTWKKVVGKGSWIFHHFLKTSPNYPWLMLYLRSDATRGFSGGYHYQTRGMSKIVPKSPNFKVKFRLDIKKGGGPNSQFYLMDIGSCWKNNGKPCDGDVTSDVTRYSEMIINPDATPWCNSTNNLRLCPPYHTFANGTRVHRNNTMHFPYDAYHVYCSPGNGKYLEEPFNYCDAYSNPQPQEILQILPHPVWGEYGYPTKKGEGWIGDGRSWELDVGRLSQSLYFYQDPGTKPVERHWTSIDLGTEIYVSGNEVAEWTVSHFDIIVPEKY
ncbi:unnamed protein product [Fraxinus pennsylvanica]|uniref:DUF7705 domain-containing protein n=1 Tax=Fraxinus pennsylvanica TaxID=56036 RepID=A0AAD2AFV8_9LAMI|nr:unnamed protein product [Fraxinus pennsylvanica]